MIRSWRTELLSALTRREGRQPVFSLFSVPSAKQEAPPQMLCTGNLILYSQASRTVRNKCLLLKQLTVCNVQWSRDDQDGNHQHLELQTQRILDPDPDQLPQGFRLSPLVHAKVVCGSEKWVCKAAVCWECEHKQVTSHLQILEPLSATKGTESFHSQASMEICVMFKKFLEHSIALRNSSKLLSARSRDECFHQLVI